MAGESLEQAPLEIQNPDIFHPSKFPSFPFSLFPFPFSLFFFLPLLLLLLLLLFLFSLILFLFHPSSPYPSSSIVFLAYIRSWKSLSRRHFVPVTFTWCIHSRQALLPLYFTAY
ncbi:hypothetical protein EYC80_003511 [Monilinia laxa]|uniref:Uncharacterized protein n=1 Tax=Monilinia laxa TaxID=61186 RepID=A0A5N6KE22_MONLA|nr:hypothetical protein EYC80_003511 [Monilinia laxa]